MANKEIAINIDINDKIMEYFEVNNVIGVEIDDLDESNV